MTGWNQIVGHAEQQAMLRNSVQQGRLAHTFLFVGPSGVGKFTFARTFAQCLMCDTFPESDLQACGTCSGCKQVLAGTHPDLFVISRPAGKSELPVELFLGPPERRGKGGLCYELSLRPMSGRRRVALIDDADVLNEAGANALLKTLEEPPPGSVLILIASAPEMVLATIRSRSQVLRFGPLRTAEVEQLLLRSALLDDPQEAAEVARLSEGSLTTAAQLVDPALREIRTVLYDGLAAQPMQSVPLAEKMLAALGTGETSEQRDMAGWIVRFAAEFYRQALLHCAGAIEENAGAVIPQVAGYLRSGEGAGEDQLELLADLLDRTLTAERHLAAKAAVPLCLETLFNDLSRQSRPPTPARGR